MSSPSNGKPTSPQKTRWGRLLLFAAALYLGVCVLLLFLENKMLYHPMRFAEGWEAPPSELAAQDVWLQAADGTRIHAWWCPVPDATGAVLFCHGNAGNLSHRTGPVNALRGSLKKSVLVFDYPSYGRSEGKLSEDGCYAAADAAYDWLAQKVPPDQLILYGESLGGGVATDLAVRKPHAALILHMTFTSIPDIAQERFPWLPARWLVRNRFDNAAKLPSERRPVFIAHGDADDVIPFSHGKTLFAIAGDPKRFHHSPGGGHDGVLTPECLAALAEFLQANSTVVSSVGR